MLNTAQLFIDHFIHYHLCFIQSLIRSEIIECYQMNVEKMMIYAFGVVWTISVCKIGLNDAEFVLTIGQ